MKEKKLNLQQLDKGTSQQQMNLSKCEVTAVQAD